VSQQSATVPRGAPRDALTFPPHRELRSSGFVDRFKAAVKAARPHSPILAGADDLFWVKLVTVAETYQLLHNWALESKGNTPAGDRTLFLGMTRSKYRRLPARLEKLAADIEMANGLARPFGAASPDFPSAKEHPETERAFYLPSTLRHYAHLVRIEGVKFGQAADYADREEMIFLGHGQGGDTAAKCRILAAVWRLSTPHNSRMRRSFELAAVRARARKARRKMLRRS